MKTTIIAMLINVNESQCKIIDNIMLVFCSAIRFSFNRLLDGIVAKDLEKDTARKYNLNIRQAKDAVENARQIIASQRQLTKINYENYTKKVKAIEKVLSKKDNLTERKKNALISKLNKRIRKQQYFKSFIDNNTIPSVIFGTKEMFLRRCKGLISNEEWKSCRNNRIYSRGDKTKKGNPNLRVVIVKGMSFLEISTLDKSKTNRAVKIQVPLYLPQKFSKKTGRINGRNYRQMFLDYLETDGAYQVEVIKRNNKYYVHITFEEEVQKVKYDAERIGIDTNPDGFALTVVDSTGNYKWSTYLSEHELLYSRGNRRTNLCGELAARLISIAKERNSSIAIEDLKFKDDMDVQHKFARIKYQFIYSTLLSMVERAAKREGIDCIRVKPQYTSKIGLYKYCSQHKLSVHNGAAMVIARRSYNYKEKIPKLLVDKLISCKTDFNKQNEWKKWSFINKIIEKKGVKTPSLWLENRGSILGISSAS